MAYDKSKGKLHEADHSKRHEKDFRVTARRNKLLGLWAAGLMNLQGSEAEAYARQVVSADLDEPGDEDVYRKVLGDFERHSVTVSRAELEKRWRSCSPRPAISWMRTDVKPSGREGLMGVASATSAALPPPSACKSPHHSRQDQQGR